MDSTHLEAQVAGSIKGRPRRGMPSCGQGRWQRHQKQGKGSGPVPKGQEAHKATGGQTALPQLPRACPVQASKGFQRPRTDHLLRMSPCPAGHTHSRLCAPHSSPGSLGAHRQGGCGGTLGPFHTGSHGSCTETEAGVLG